MENPPLRPGLLVQLYLWTLQINVLAEARGTQFKLDIPYAKLGDPNVTLTQGYLFTFVTVAESQSVVFTSCCSFTMYFLSEDCSGPRFSSGNTSFDDDGTIYIRDQSFGFERLLSKSFRRGRSGDFDKNLLTPKGDCTQRTTAVDLTPVVEYTPPPELANPVYPVRLEQLP